MTKKTPELSQEATEAEAGQSPRKSRRKPGRDVNEIYRLNDDPDEEPEFLITLPAHVNVRKFVKRDFGAGDYLVKNRVGGKFKGESELHVEFDADEIVTGRVDDDDVAEEGLELPTGTTDNDARIVRLVNAVMDARERRERASQPQPGPLDLLREVEQLAERRADRDRQMRESIRAEVTSMMPKEPPAPREAELSDRQRLELAVIKEAGAIPTIFKELRQAIGTVDRVDEPESWTDKILGFAKEFVPYIGPVAGPIIGQRLISLLGKVDDAALMQAAGIQPGQLQQPLQQQPPAQQYPMGAPQQTAPPPITAAQPAATGEAEVSTVTFEGVLEGIITDLQEGNEPDEAIDDIAKLTTLQPDFLPVIAKLISQPNEQLVQMLSQAKGVDLMHLLNTDEYIDALRDGLKKRVRLPAPPAGGAATNNGHGAAALPV